MRSLTAAIFIALSPMPSLAQTPGAYEACSAKATTQTALTTCAAEELTRAEAGLNVTYGQLLHKVGSRSDALAKVRAAERAWVAYRDAYLEAMYPAKAKQAEYGSMYPMEADLVLADLTRQHTIALANLLKANSGCGTNSIIGCRKHGRP